MAPFPIKPAFPMPSDPRFDVFGRPRATGTRYRWASKLLVNDDPLRWADEQISGSGTSSTFLAPKASVQLATTTAETSSAAEIARGAVANTITGGTVLESGHVNTSDLTTVLNSAYQLGGTVAGVMDRIVLAVAPISGTVAGHGSVTWKEAV